MNRDELLTKLAMELGEWPERREGHDGYVRAKRECSEVTGVNIPVEYGPPTVEAGGNEYYGLEYLQRRTELINKPSWDDAPEWAEWLAQDKRGEWYFYPALPEQSDDMWTNDEPKTGIWVDAHCRGRIPAGHDWRETLEPRPAFNESRADIIGQNGNDGDHYETSTYCDRCGGEYWTPPHEYCPCLDATWRSDGSTASYYELPEGATELQDLISYRNLNAQDGEIFRAIYRKGRASHSDALRDAKKVLFYAKAEVQRLERYGR